MNEIAVYYFQNAYSEVLVNRACLNKTGKRMGEVKNEAGGALHDLGRCCKRDNFKKRKLFM